MQFRFKIEKERIYRGHRPDDILTFQDWFYRAFLPEDKQYKFAVQEGEKYIKFKLETIEKQEPEIVRQYLLKILTRFKTEFIDVLIADLRMFYLDTTHKEHKKTKDYLTPMLFSKNGENKASLFEVLNGIKERFMSFDLLVSTKEENTETEKPISNNAVEPEDEEDVELDLVSKDKPITELKELENKVLSLDVTDIDCFDEDDIF